MIIKLKTIHYIQKCSMHCTQQIIYTIHKTLYIYLNTPYKYCTYTIITPYIHLTSTILYSVVWGICNIFKKCSPFLKRCCTHQCFKKSILCICNILKKGSFFGKRCCTHLCCSLYDIALNFHCCLYSIFFSTYKFCCVVLCCTVLLKYVIQYYVVCNY